MDEISMWQYLNQR